MNEGNITQHHTTHYSNYDIIIALSLESVLSCLTPLSTDISITIGTAIGIGICICSLISPLSVPL